MSPAYRHSVSPEEPERGRREMEYEWELRQQNILPLQSAWNEGRIYGRMAKGRQPLTGALRAGIFMVGVEWVGGAFVVSMMDWPYRKVGPYVNALDQRLPEVWFARLPMLLLIIALGFRFCWVALKPSTPR